MKNKYQKEKIKNLEWRLDDQKYNIKIIKKNQSQNYEKCICEVALKMGSFWKDNRLKK